MKSTIRPILAVLGLAVSSTAFAQFVPPPPARPFPGYINERLRAADVYMNAWDIGVNVRARYEGKEDAGFTYSGQNADFRLNGPGATVDNNNGYILTRIMPRVAYTAKSYAFTVEARSSASAGDERGNQRVAQARAGRAARAGMRACRCGHG